MQNLNLQLRPGQSIELLKELHILTPEGKINQDSRRKLKQVYHLYQFIEPLLKDLSEEEKIHVADIGAGKSYLGFIINDLFLKNLPNSKILAIESRQELINSSIELKNKLNFKNMDFLPLSVKESFHSDLLPETLDLVTALHACDTATDDAIQLALNKKAKHVVIVPCCQAEVAGLLRATKGKLIHSTSLVELFRHPIHTREFGSHLTNVLRCLWLESRGYQVTVTELIGWEHSMKNELIMATFRNLPGDRAKNKINDILKEFHLSDTSFAEKFNG
ncbi:MAG: SAM-dependent methyltransferase [Bacteriovoracaceae bacterium]|nr:SAM-dependent methyltransferase [Bacteriovoracaceae bacterium]